MLDPALVEALRAHLLGRTFGALRFWGFAVLRPHDQAYEVVSTHAEGDRLELVFVHASRHGRPGVLVIEGPEGLRTSPQGLTVQAARRVALDSTEAQPEGAQVTVRTPQGEGRFDRSGAPALTLEF